MKMFVERKEEDSIIEGERATLEATEANWNAAVVKVGVKEEKEEEDKPHVLYIDAPHWAEREGGTGFVSGIDSIESVFRGNIVNAKTAFRGVGCPIMSSEQIFAGNNRMRTIPPSFFFLRIDKSVKMQV